MESSIKLVATDMDGTLLNSKKEKPKDFIPWVKKHKEIHTVIASGRQYQTLENDFSEIKDDLIFICENGALIYKNGELLDKCVLTKESLYECLDIIEKVEFACPILCGTRWAYMLDKYDDDIKKNAGMYFANLEQVNDLREIIQTQELVKIAVYFSNHDAKGSYKHLVNVPNEVRPVLSGERWIDIFSPVVNKGTAIKKIQKMFDVKKEECMAFGDYLNDREMLLSVGESYCMENGLQELKDISKHIAPSNDNDGVMTILRKL